MTPFSVLVARLLSRSQVYDLVPAARPLEPVRRLRLSYENVWVLVPASPVGPVILRHLARQWNSNGCIASNACRMVGPR